MGEVDEFIAKGYLDGVSATDDIDKTVEIKVTGKVEKPASGTNGVYKLTYIAKDSDGNVREVIRTITVTNQVPVFKGLSEIIVYEGENIDLEYGVTASDYEDGDITSNIIYPDIDLSKLSVGKHTIQYKVIDRDGNETIVDRYVNVSMNIVNENHVPVIVLSNNKITINNTDKINLLDYVDIAYDYEEGDLKDRVTYTAPGDINTLGNYKVTYSVKDKNGATATAVLEVEVIENIVESDNNDNSTNIVLPPITDTIVDNVIESITSSVEVENVDEMNNNMVDEIEEVNEVEAEDTNEIEEETDEETENKLDVDSDFDNSTSSDFEDESNTGKSSEAKGFMASKTAKTVAAAGVVGGAAATAAAAATGKLSFAKLLRALFRK